MKKLVRLALFDDEALRRDLIATCLQSSGRYRVTALHGLSREAVGHLERFAGDGILLMLDAFTQREVDLGEALHRRLPACRIVLCTSSPQVWHELQRRMGTAGSRHRWRPEVCVDAVLGAGSLIRFLDALFHPGLAAGSNPAEAASWKQAVPPLSPRERQILRFAAGGMTYKEIALQLGISHKSVATYAVRMCRKLGIFGIRGLTLAMAARR